MTSRDTATFLALVQGNFAILEEETAGDSGRDDAW